MPDLYLFIDEAGNFDFTPSGSKYFMLNVIATTDPCQGVAELLSLRHEILKLDPSTYKVKSPRDCSHFHCADDSQPVRDKVFEVIRKLDITCFATLVQKNKTNPAIREPHILYERMFRSIVPHVISRCRPDTDVLVFTAQLQMQQKKRAFISALKASLASRVSSPYHIFHHPTESHHMLQVSDYCCWAIQRFHEKRDDRSRLIVKHQIASEFDMFARGTTTYY